MAVSEKTSGFLADGPRRLRSGLQARIEMEVREDFAAEMAGAGFFGRLLLRSEMRSEVRRRTNDHVPDSRYINWMKR